MPCGRRSFSASSIGPTTTLTLSHHGWSLSQTFLLACHSPRRLVLVSFPLNIIVELRDFTDILLTNCLQDHLSLDHLSLDHLSLDQSLICIWTYCHDTQKSCQTLALSWICISIRGFTLIMLCNFGPFWTNLPLSCYVTF